MRITSMSTRSVIHRGLSESSRPSEDKRPIQRFFRHFSQLQLSDQLSLILASALGLVLSLILSPVILGLGLWQAWGRFFGR